MSARKQKILTFKVGCLLSWKELVKLTTWGIILMRHILYHICLPMTCPLAVVLRCLAGLCQEACSMNQCFLAQIGFSCPLLSWCQDLRERCETHWGGGGGVGFGHWYTKQPKGSAVMWKSFSLSVLDFFLWLSLLCAVVVFLVSLIKPVFLGLSHWPV